MHLLLVDKISTKRLETLTMSNKNTYKNSRTIQSTNPFFGREYDIQDHGFSDKIQDTRDIFENYTGRNNTHHRSSRRHDHDVNRRSSNGSGQGRNYQDKVSSRNPFLDTSPTSQINGSNSPTKYPSHSHRSHSSTLGPSVEKLTKNSPDGQNSRCHYANSVPPSYNDSVETEKNKSYYTRENIEASFRRKTEGNSHHRHRGHRQKSSSSKSKKKQMVPKNVDTIDKLDATGIFGGSFHHDGPFDAVTPHRNKDIKIAPVMAFPIDGPNNTISGSSKKRTAINDFFNTGNPGDSESNYKYKSHTDSRNSQLYISWSVNGSTTTLNAIKPNFSNIIQFDAKMKTDLVCGPTTMGLGSTTFLDGAPASKAAIQEDIRNHSRQAQTIQSKKSLSQRLKAGSTEHN